LLIELLFINFGKTVSSAA